MYRQIPFIRRAAVCLCVLGLLAAATIPKAVQASDAAPRPCILIAPPDPLTAIGLGSLWRLVNCTETDPNKSVFVQATIFDPATKALSVYNPLVVTRLDLPAAPPVVPLLPPGAIVAIWVGANDTVHVIGGRSWNLEGQEEGPNGPMWVQGYRGSSFVQQSYLNVRAFDRAVNAANVAIPPIGVAVDGLPCPTARDFSIIDQDPSDNTTADYLVSNGQLAQDTPANRTLFPTATKVVNGSDERTLNRVDTALGCTPWKLPDLADVTGTQKVTAGLLQEHQAARYQAAPVALIPPLDPFTLVGGAPNLGKLNLYRAQVDQPPASTVTNGADWCNGLNTIGEPRLKADKPWTVVAGTPFPLIADSLYTFLAFRFDQTWQLLDCQNLIGVASPVTLTYNGAGVVTGATYR